MQRNIRGCARRTAFCNLSTSSSCTIRGTIPPHGRGVAKGQYAEMDRIFTKQDIDTFGKLIGDDNLLHSSHRWDDVITQIPSLQANLEAGLIQFESQGDDSNAMTRPLVHGMLVSSLFSSIFGTLVPGCVYIHQSLHFRGPVFANDPLLGRIQIERIRKWSKAGVVVECDTKVLCQEKEVVSGSAKVWLPGGFKEKVP